MRRFMFTFASGFQWYVKEEDVPLGMPFTLQAVLDWIYFVDTSTGDRLCPEFWSVLEEWGDLVSVIPVTV